jgi:hypothetical protein
MVRHVQQPAAGVGNAFLYPLQPAVGNAGGKAVLLVSVLPAGLCDVLAVAARLGRTLLSDFSYDSSVGRQNGPALLPAFERLTTIAQVVKLR